MVILSCQTQLHLSVTQATTLARLQYLTYHLVNLKKVNFIKVQKTRVSGFFVDYSFISKVTTKQIKVNNSLNIMFALE